MSLLIQNKSRSTPLIISISSLFSRSKLTTLTLQAQKSTSISTKNLQINEKSTKPGAVIMSVQTPKKNLLWEGPVPISSNSTPVIINPQTKSVLYGETRLPSLKIRKLDRSMIPIGGLFIVILIILIWILVFRSNNKSR